MAIHLERQDGGAYCNPSKEFKEMTTVDEQATCRRCLQCKNGKAVSPKVKAWHNAVVGGPLLEKHSRFMYRRINRGAQV